MGKTLIDSNVIIDYLGRTLPVPGVKFVSIERKKGFKLSIITRIELLGSRILKTDLSLITEFIGSSTIIDLDDNVAEKAIQIRQNHSIQLADSIIAATALVHDLILVTRNVRDFKSVPLLKLVNPWLRHIK